ncbi:hypothetical protein M513_05052 [Trichuris suis]|uniref:WAP domain-containing protein n=1 Tax=Trichuris suis TaxID=68888 RepID=A0A085M9Y7_9BILA|nr:hypothetical protein M513_05052 [Trichuris suis]
MLFFYVCFYYLHCYAYVNGDRQEESSDAFVSAESKESHSVEKVKVDQYVTATPAPEGNESRFVNEIVFDQSITKPELSNNSTTKAVTPSTDVLISMESKESRLVEKVEIDRNVATTPESSSSMINETKTTLLSIEGNESRLANETVVDQSTTKPEVSNSSTNEAVTTSTDTVESFFSAESKSACSHEKTKVASRANKTTEGKKPTSAAVEILVSSESEYFDSFASIEVNHKVTASVSCCSSKTTKRNKTLSVNRKDHPLGICPLVTRRSRRTTYACTEDAHCRSMRMICCLGVCEYPLPLGPKAHDGSCLALPIRPITNATCAHDDQCADDEKCCQNGAEIHCVKASRLHNFNRKPGFCDRVKPDEMMQQYKLCNGDTDCFKMDKCCPTSSTYRCMPAVRYSPPPKHGKCKLQSPYLLPVVVPLCYNDYECIGIQKCCYDGRQDRCMNPHSTLEELD